MKVYVTVDSHCYELFRILKNICLRFSIADATIDFISV